MVAEVIINTKAKELNKTFDYIVPKNLIDEISVGARVFVPFGNEARERVSEAFVISLKEKSSYAKKEIIKIEDNILTDDNIELAKLMARRYFSNFSECIKLMLPPGDSNKNIENRISEKVGNFVYLKKDIEEIDFDIEIRRTKK